MTDQDVIRHALNSENADDEFWWHHPSGVGVSNPPRQLHEADGTLSDVWNWHDKKAGRAFSPLPPAAALT